MSTIKLPELPELPEQDLVDVIYSPDGDEGAIFEWDEDKLKAWATAYAEQAVREALAAQVPVTDEKAAFEAWWQNSNLGERQQAWTGWRGRAALAHASVAELVTVYLDAGHLREVLAGNDMPVSASSERLHGMVPMYAALQACRPIPEKDHG